LLKKRGIGKVELAGGINTKVNPDYLMKVFTKQMVPE